MTDLFEIAPQQIQGSAIFSRGQTIRREIRRWWTPSPTRWVAWLMTNPSRARADRNDPTALRVTNFSRAWGYDGWIGVNLYPFISSTMPEMWAWADWESNGPDYYARDDMMFNIGDIERVGREASLRIVAFGAEPINRDEIWVDECLDAFGQPADMPGVDERLHCLGVNKHGQPLHPLARGRMRVPDKTLPKVWRV